MQCLNELIAWGSVECDATEAELAGDSAHRDVKDFVDEGYLRGWGLTGRSVELDVGAAIFALKKDVNNWNLDCVAQIEEKYGNICEAVDVKGFDPRESQKTATLGEGKKPVTRNETRCTRNSRRCSSCARARSIVRASWC